MTDNIHHVDNSRNNTIDNLVNNPNINVIPYKSEIKHIYHISDLHIHLYKRHQEYEIVFNNVLEYLRNERRVNKIKGNSRKDISMICVITGDILHSKSDLSPECISITYKFLKDLLEILPVIIIPGNHDLNMNNKDRMDSLTPIICDLPRYFPIHYLNKTGVWLMGNILFSHASIFDYHIISPEWIDTEISKLDMELPDKIHKIILYHGRVNGAQLFNGIGIDGEKDTISKKTITPSSFDGYDLALLGDIHKHQFLDYPKCTRGYAGSLIQQNLGEDLTGHGLIKWSLNNLHNHPCGEFVPIKNNYGYITFRIKDGENNYETYLHGSIPDNIRVRILYNNTPQTVIDEFVEFLASKHKLLEYSYQNDESANNLNTTLNIDNVDITNNEEGNETETRREFDINNIDYQNQLLEEIINTNFANRLNEGELETIKTLNRDANNLFNDTGDNENERRIKLPGQRFKLLRLEFDNLFSYGANNVIEFKYCKGVVGIIASNHMGKSAILDIILSGLFDKVARKGNIKDMINNRKSDYRIKLEIQSGIYKYIIVKSGSKKSTSTKKGNTSTKNECSFTRVNLSTGRNENLAKDTAKQTRAYICEVFGSFEDMLNTNFSIQNNSTGFIDADNATRRSELEKILRFDFLSGLAKHAGKQYTETKGAFLHLQKTMPPERINQVNGEITETEQLLTQSQTVYQNLGLELNDKQTRINELNQQLNPDADTKLDNLLNDIDLAKEDILGNQDTNSLLINQYSILENNRDQIKKDLDEQFNKNQSLLFKLSEFSFIDNDIITNSKNIITVSEEDRTSHKKMKKWRENIKSLVKQLFSKSREYKCSLEDTSRSIGIKIKEQRQTLQNYVLAKSNWNQTDFDNIINKLTGNIISLKQEIEQISEYNDNLQKQEEKCEKYRKQIEDIRLDLDKLQSCEQIPEFLKTEFSTLNLKNLSNDITEIENNIFGDDNQNNNALHMNKNSYMDLKPKIMAYGWAQELGARVKASKKADEKSIKYRAKLETINNKLTSAESKCKELRKEISNGQQIINKHRELESELELYKKDYEVYNVNLGLLNSITELENEEMTYRSKISNNTFELLLDDIKSAVNDYEDLDMRYKEIKTKLKSIGGIQSEIDDLMITVDKNNNIREQIMIEMKTIKELNDKLNDMNIQMEKYKDKISGLKGQLSKMREDCIAKVQKEKLMNIYGIYRDALKMMPMVLIKKVQPVIERKVNDLLTTVTDFTVKFVMDDNKIDIYLDRPVYGGNPILINNSSGFERFISSLAIRIALMEISQLPSPNFMAIDEGWSCFDNENIANMDVILNYLVQKFDFIITISHLQVVRQHCDIQITLQKTDDGYSHVYYAIDK